MYRLVRFFKRYYAVFLFVLLEAGAISYYANSTSYTRATLARRRRTGDRGNRGLLRLGGRLLFAAAAKTPCCSNASPKPRPDYMPPYPQAIHWAARTDGMKYLFGTAKVVSNSIARQDNFFVIDKGTADGIEENMAVLSPEGAVAGYVRRHSDHYAVCMSVLNGSFSIGGRLKGSEYFGSVYWDGTDPREMTMVDIPRYADVKRGDSVLSAYSLRFPPDCFIGTVASVSESPDGIYHVIKIRLGAKMNALSDVLLVKYTDYEELETLAGEHFSDADKKKK